MYSDYGSEELMYNVSNQICLTKLTLTVSPSQANVTSQRASLCNKEVRTPVRFVGWLFQRKQNCWSIVPWSVLYL